MTKIMLEYTMMAEVVVALSCLVLIISKNLLRDFLSVAGFLSVVVVEQIVSIAIMFFRPLTGLDKHRAYNVLAYTRWSCLVIEYVLVLVVIYGVFSTAMKPMPGLHRAGKLIFRWVAGVSLIISLGLAVGPRTSGFVNYLSVFAERVQQSTSVLMLCLLLFVCFATRPLGLTYRSRIFGVSLGLGIFSTFSLVTAAWLSTSAANTVYAPVYVIGALGFLSGLIVWAVYFAMPEPERALILLPTTSPFFFWNKISEALGDSPGFVAVAGFKPDMLAPGELRVLKESSRAARAREKQADEQSGAMTSAGLRTVPMQR
jgi:hypothetical protein